MDRRRHVGFNGATARTRWRVDISAEPASRSDSASTGPPRERGGEDVDARCKTCRRRRLQRGHRANAVESAQHRSSKSTTAAMRASTGPPRERGGERMDRRSIGTDAAVASTGPPRERGGERRIARTAYRKYRCGFNGATARTRWRGTSPIRFESGALRGELREGRFGVPLGVARRHAADHFPCRATLGFQGTNPLLREGARVRAAPDRSIIRADNELIEIHMHHATIAWRSGYR